MLRAIVVALALLGVGAVPGHYGPRGDAIGQGLDAQQRQLGLHWPFDRNGFKGAELPIAGFPQPDLIWDATQPTANIAPGATSTFSLTGSVTTKGAPFCPNGDYTAVEENDGRCLSTRYFTTDDRYIASSTTVAQIGTVDRTVCVLFRADAGSGLTNLLDTSDGAADGWQMSHDPANNRTRVVVNDGATTATADLNTASNAGAWQFSCVVFDHGGNFKVCNNSSLGTQCGTPVAIPNSPNSIDNSAALRIGTLVDGTTGLVGDISKIYSWSDDLSNAQLLQFFYSFEGIATSRNQAGTYAASGTTSCWIDGKIEAFNMYMPRLGCAIAAGETNAGLGNTGYFAEAPETSLLLRSRELTSSWTETGTAIVSGPSTTNTPFRDGRGFYRITDDDGASVEYISQVYASATPVTGGRLNIVIVAKADSAQTLDVQVVEATGCAGSTANFTAKSITTGWARYVFNHTVADGACTDFTVRISPTDFATAASTGHADMFVNMFYNATGSNIYAPQYIETAAATVASAGDAMYFTPAQVNMPATWAASGTWRIEWRNIYYNVTGVTDNANLVMIDDDTAGPTNYWRVLARNAQTCASFTGSSINFLCLLTTPSTDPDQRYTYFVRFDDATDVHTGRTEGAGQVTASTALAGPTTIVYYRIGTGQFEASGLFGAMIYQDFRIYR